MDNSKLCYILGALRDSSIDIRKGKNYELKFSQKDERWLFYISDLIYCLFGERFNVRNNMLRITNKNIVLEIQNVSEMVSPQKYWKTPSFVFKLDVLDLIPYIQGFWDAEGGLPRKPLIAKQKYLSFDQKNKQCLFFLRTKLLKLGYRPTNLTFTNHVWQFRLTRKNDIISYIQNIGSSHPEKSSRMLKMISSLSP